MTRQLEAEQESLFASSVVAPLAEKNERELLSDAYDAVAVLSLGPDDGIGAHTAARLRDELLAAVLELARRWNLDAPGGAQ